MSLFGSIQLGANTLQAMQIGLQVTGNNIANANTPGYIRQETVYKPAPVQKIGGLVLGLGVQVDGIVQKIDKFVQDRLVGAKGDRAGADIQQKAYNEVETVLNGLSGTTDLSTTLTTFINSIQGVLGDQNSAATRNLVIGNGDALTKNISNLSSRVEASKTNTTTGSMRRPTRSTALTEQIRKLNVQIATVEGGGSSASDAGGLRVQRQPAIDRLSEIVGIKVTEQPSGADNISVNGEFLVFEGQRRQVEVKQVERRTDRSRTRFNSPTRSRRSVTSTGELAGLYTARDQIAGNFLDGLDKFSSSLALNSTSSIRKGRAATVSRKLTSVNSVADADTPLEKAGLAFTPMSGQFRFHGSQQEPETSRRRTRFPSRLNGLDDDTTLNSLASQIDAIDGISASVTTAGNCKSLPIRRTLNLHLPATRAGLLAALGLNTFFTGSTARDIGVNSELIGIGNDAKFAASAGGLGQDADTATPRNWRSFLNTPLGVGRRIDAAGRLRPDRQFREPRGDGREVDCERLSDI